MVWSRPLVAALVCNTCALMVSVGVASTDGQHARRKKTAAVLATAATPESIAASPQFALQVALDKAGFSPGEIDGRSGAITSRALAAFQKDRGLSQTGIDEATWSALGVTPGRADAVIAHYTIAADDVKGPFVERIPKDMVEKSKLPVLAYTSALEALGEKFHTEPPLLRALNPAATFAAGESILAPAIGAPTAAAASLRGVVVSVSRAAEALTVKDASGKLLLFAPVTVGSDRDPLPIGEWTVTAVQRNPVFSYNPDLFWDADPSHTKVKIPAGPNNPVGAVWIDLDRPHYGIHGTPEPSTIGYRQSHGCVRLTNWDALKVASLVKVGTPVRFEP